MRTQLVGKLEILIAMKCPVHLDVCLLLTEQWMIIWWDVNFEFLTRKSVVVNAARPKHALAMLIVVQDDHAWLLFLFEDLANNDTANLLTDIGTLEHLLDGEAVFESQYAYLEHASLKSSLPQSHPNVRILVLSHQFAPELVALGHFD